MLRSHCFLVEQTSPRSFFSMLLIGLRDKQSGEILQVSNHSVSCREDQK